MIRKVEQHINLVSSPQILVCIIDFVFPPKAPGPAPVVTSAGLKADDDVSVKTV